MGRGRAKAKQTKVARELKYSSPTTDFASLQRELAGSGGPSSSHHNGVRSDDYDSSRWDEDDDDEDWRSSR